MLGCSYAWGQFQNSQRRINSARLSENYLMHGANYRTEKDNAIFRQAQ